MVLLEKKEQMMHMKPLQIGTDPLPCKVLFGLHEIDENSSWRTITVIPDESTLKVLESFDADHDDLQDIVKESKDGKKIIKVKVSKDQTKCYNVDKSKADMKDIAKHDITCKLIVRPRWWKMDGQEGVSIRASIIVVTASVDMDDDVDDMI